MYKQTMVIENADFIDLRKITAHGVKMQQIQVCLYDTKVIFQEKAADHMKTKVAQIDYQCLVEPLIVEIRVEAVQNLHLVHSVGPAIQDIGL